MGRTIPLVQHRDEPHSESTAARLNWLRAGVLGADDGIVSVAGIVLGVAGATDNRSAILTAGIAGWAAGAVSMALGEYVSVAAQHDVQTTLLDTERRELREDPESELAELASLYRRKGLSDDTARAVAAELTEHDALAAHAEIELGLDPDELTSPWQAAGSSALAFTAGAVLPLLAVTLPPGGWRVPVTFVAVLLALAFAGAVSARLGGTAARTAVARMVLGGAVAMAVTYGIGQLVGQSPV